MASANPGDLRAQPGCDPIRDAFALRRPLEPWSGRIPVPDAALERVWSRLIEAPPARRKRLAYVHIPFCANHCHFCGFYRGPARREHVRDYASLPIAELAREADAPGIAAGTVHAVYLGGGTPTALPAGELHRLVLALRRHLPLAPDCEITVEGRCLGFDAEKVDACLAAGANRISIGVQTFDTDVRRRQGRRASRAELLRFLGALRDRERAAIVLDLLIGLPGQTPEIWREDLRTCIELAPDGVDLYALNVFRGTPLERAISAGRSPAAASLAQQGAMYAEAAELLAAVGWSQISNSHWARTTRERNLYNLLLKQGAECLAYGAGAGGSLGRHAYSLEPDLERYRAAVAAGRKPLLAMREADPHQALREHVAGGIEVGRLDLACLAPEVLERVAPLLAQWRAAGLVEAAGPILRLTTAGRFWAPNLVRGLVDALIKTEPRRTMS